MSSIEKGNDTGSTPGSITPGYVVKSISGAGKEGQASIRRSKKDSHAASINRTSVTKSFHRGSAKGWDEDGDTTKTVQQLVTVSGTRASRLSALISQSVYQGANEDETEDVKHFFCVPLTNNVKALFIMMIMFAVISLAQYFAAAAAHSQSLKADVVSMGVDALSYFGNILGESSDIPSQRIVLQLFFSLASITLLLIFNTQIIIESIGIMKDNEGEDGSDGEEEGVEGSIVLAFALFGLLFDAICLWAYHHYAKMDAEIEFQLMKKESVEKGGEVGTEVAKIKKPQVNMLTALLHVSADLMRSTCTFVEGIVLLAGKLTPSDQAYIDAICGIVICSTLYAASAYALIEWFTEMSGWFTGLGAEITVYVPELDDYIVIKPDKAGHSKAADAFIG